MSEPIFEQCVDERGNISVRVSRDVQVLTREEANHIEAEYKRMQAENAKLRELVRDMGELLDVFTECNFACKHYHNGCIGDCYYVNARRELGIEV